MSACRNCDAPTSGAYCGPVCEGMDALPSPRDDMATMTRVVPTESRLTDSDRNTMRRAVRDSLSIRRATSATRTVTLTTIDVEALRRVAVHAIGCSDVDLRDSELAERDALVAETCDHAGMAVTS